MSEHGYQFRSYLLESLPYSRTMSIGTNLPIWLPLLPSGMLTGRIGWSWRLKSRFTSPFSRFLAKSYHIMFLNLLVLCKTIFKRVLIYTLIHSLRLICESVGLTWAFSIWTGSPPGPSGWIANGVFSARPSFSEFP